VDITNILAVAVALAMDAFAVSIATGVCLKSVSPRQFFRLSWHFGFFQGMMTFAGWGAGLTVRSLMERYDHWVAFSLLAFVAVNMIRSAFGEKDEGAACADPTKEASLVLLSVATSIDAFAVGLSMAIIHSGIWLPVVLISLVALLFTVAGLYFGSRAGQLFGLRRYAEFAGAMVLIAIGINILYEHGALGAVTP